LATPYSEGEVKRAQRDEQDFKYRQNRFKETKLFPTKMLNTLENRFDRKKVLSGASEHKMNEKDN
jgi:UDP-N-acetylenolpyruvoylglucosamine reductase